MPSPLKGYWNIQNVLQITDQAFHTRFNNMERDVVKGSIKVKKITVYDGKNPGQSRTRFEILAESWPQYAPYYTKFDKRGRERTYQRTTKHQYTVTIQMDKLSIVSPIKFRTGSDKKWEFNPSKSLIKSKENPYGKYLSIGDYNAQALGVHGDFFFRQSWIRKEEDCLFGRNYAGWAPKETNPGMLVFATKQEIACFLTLMERGVLTKE